MNLIELNSHLTWRNNHYGCNNNTQNNCYGSNNYKQLKNGGYFKSNNCTLFNDVYEKNKSKKTKKGCINKKESLYDENENGKEKNDKPVQKLY